MTSDSTRDSEKPRPAKKSAAQEKSSAPDSRAGSRASEGADANAPAASETPAASGTKKKRTAAELALLARVFGDTLPSTTKDERTPEPSSGTSSDEWLRAQKPPHHG